MVSPNFVVAPVMLQKEEGSAYYVCLKKFLPRSGGEETGQACVGDPGRRQIWCEYILA